MYSVKDYVVCGSSGVCRVEDIRVPDYAVLKVPHYVLQPLYDLKTKVTIPVEGGHCHLRSTITRGEAEDFSKQFHACETLFCNDSRYLGKFASEILSGGEWLKWLGLFKGFCEKRSRQKSRGKGLTMREDALYNRVKNLVVGELAFVLKMSVEDVEISCIRALEDQLE